MWKFLHIIFLILCINATHAEDTSKLLKRYYHNKTKDCYVQRYQKLNQNAYFCMKPILDKEIDDFKYLVMAGDLMENEKIKIETDTPGLVVLYIFEKDKEHFWKILSSNTPIEIGSHGKFPRDWKLIKNHQDFHSFQTHTDFCHREICTSNYLLFSPVKDRIEKVLEIPRLFDDSEKLIPNKTQLVTELIWSESKNSNYFDLNLKVKGTYDGVPLEKILVIPRNKKSHIYEIPKDLVLKN